MQLSQNVTDRNFQIYLFAYLFRKLICPNVIHPDVAYVNIVNIVSFVFKAPEYNVVQSYVAMKPVFTFRKLFVDACDNDAFYTNSDREYIRHARKKKNFAHGGPWVN